MNNKSVFYYNGDKLIGTLQLIKVSTSILKDIPKIRKTGYDSSSRKVTYNVLIDKYYIKQKDVKLHDGRGNRFIYLIYQPEGEYYYYFPLLNAYLKEKELEDTLKLYIDEEGIRISYSYSSESFTTGQFVLLLTD